MQLFLKEKFAAVSAYLCRNRTADIFFILTASRNISMFFNERAAAFEKILRTNSEIY